MSRHNIAWQYQRRDRKRSWSRNVGRMRLMVICARRMVRTHGPFTIVAPWRQPTSHEAPKLRRALALRLIRRTLDHMRPGDETHVRKGNGDVVVVLRAVAKVDPKRLELVQWAKWGVAHSPAIHYSQARPIPQYNQGHLPMTLDCSGSTILYCKWANIPDPSGGSYEYGDTDTILAHLRKRNGGPRTAQLGDLILWANGSDGKHVAIVIEPGSNPLLASHGSESGPIAIRFSDEDRFHASETPHVLDVLS